MIAADTSTWIAFFQGDDGKDVELLDQSLGSRQVLMVPQVLTELLSDPKITSDVFEDSFRTAANRDTAGILEPGRRTSSERIRKATQGSPG